MKFISKMTATILTLLTTLSMNVSEVIAKKPFKSSVMHKIEVKSEDNGGTLLFSDSPEYVKEDGILYRDIVEGDCRVLFYHLNESKSNKRIAIVVENEYEGLNTVDITRGAVAEPSGDFLWVGKSVQTRYMSETFHDSLYMLKGDKNLLNAEISDYVIRNGQLIYGVYDFYAAHPVKVSVLMYPQYEDPLEYINEAKMLTTDEQRLRGTYKGMNRTLTMKEAYDPDIDGIKYIMLADDVNDKYKIGIDSTDNSEVKNFGNYGINYKLKLKMKRPTKIYLTPLGGVYAGAMRVTYKGESDMIETPQNRIYFGEKTPREPESVKKAREEGLSLLTTQTELTELGTYEGEVEFEYSPPGASNLPVDIILMPAEE